MVRTVLLSLALLLATGPLEAEPYKGFPRGDRPHFRSRAERPSGQSRAETRRAGGG